MFVTGRVPLRRAGDGTRPQPGADGAHDWTGFASGHLLPRIVAPASGHIVTANEPIASATFLGADGFDDFRARRILELLGGGDRHTVAEFAAMQMDVLDPVAQRLLPRLKEVAPRDDLSRAALAVVAQWNGVAAAAEPAPLIFNAWMSRFADLLLTRLGVPPDARAAVQPWPAFVDRALSPSGATLCGGDCDALLGQSLATATASLAEKFGSDPSAWRWGRAHQAVFAHPLLRFVPVLGWLVAGRVAAPGDETTIDAAGFRTDSFAAVHGPSFRAVYDLADLDRSLFVAAPGQSGNPLSGLARNLLARWRDGRSFVIEDAIGAGASHIRLEPTGGRP
jgi:penicillin amidase